MSGIPGASMKYVNSSTLVIAGAAILALVLAAPLSWFLEKDSSKGNPASSFGIPHTTTYDPADRSSTSTR
ncbi:hypothetical protein [Roseomonas indoligenes]|uniref:Uncharacterized protein n=1 Tax=Roseomonas indoligenes TaxID=2820811 RepID=A0A940N3Z5_9PROT|nr:hypothetical protein [Pararoseomonas indoligenes]MBP0495571.1 hypothetical protein [Pararoseomonas indoligenes]